MSKEQLFEEFYGKLYFDDEGRLEFFDVTENGIVNFAINKNVTISDFDSKYKEILQDDSYIKRINEKYKNQFILGEENKFQKMVVNSNKNNEKNMGNIKN